MKDQTTSQVNDSTVNSNNAVKSSAGSPAESSSGKIAYAQSFNSSNYMSVSSSSTFKPANNLTISGWVNPTSFPTAWSKITTLDYRADGTWINPYISYSFERYSSTSNFGFEWTVDGTIYGINSGKAMNIGSWNYVAVTLDGSTVSTYVNGTAGSTADQNGSIDYNTSQDLAIGTKSPYTPGEGWNGLIDELRISTTSRSANWLMTEYSNQSDPIRYQTLGTEQLELNEITTINMNISAGTVDANGVNFSVSGTFANTATLKLTGDETVVLTNDSDSGTVEYSATSGARALQDWAYYNLKINGSGGTFNLPAAIDVNGNLDLAAGTLVANGYDLNLAGNWSNSGAFTPGANKVILDGSGSQTVTCGGTGSGKTFYDLVITNSSTSGVLFSDSCKIDGTLTATTPSAKLTFNAGSTYAVANISLNGQAVGTRIVMRSSSVGSKWYFNISQASPVARYVDVQDSDASGGNEIDATVGCYNAGNNTNWDFGSGGSAPVNNSLIFTNPYSSNIAVADETTEWNFEVKVTDDDGATDINFIELRFANAADSTQPYDSLKFRWTESTDTFSEEADSQNAAILTSTSADSFSSGNQWTINFKIKLNNNFLDKDTNYPAEIYAIDDGALSDTDNYADKYQVNALFLSLELDSSTIVFGNLLPSSVITGTTIAIVNTNYPNGYILSAHDGVSGSSSCLLHTDTITRIADYSGTVANPTLWSGTGLGICLYSATNKEAKWGTGTTEDSADNKYAGVPEAITAIHNKTGSPTTNDENKIGYKVVVPNTQKTGDYSGNITYTATGALN